MDATQLSTYIMCPERYRLKFEEKLVRTEADTTDAPLKFGQAMHAGLQAHYQGKDMTTVQAAFMAVYPVALDPTDLARTPEFGCRVLTEYVPWAVQHEQGWKMLAVEEVESFQPNSFAQPWQVKKDLVVETPSGIWVVDHKTTIKKLTDFYWRQFEPNMALTGYVSHTIAKYGQCSGVIINAISLGYRSRAYRGEPAGFHWQPERQIFSRTKEQVADWEQNVSHWMSRLEVNKQVSHWGKNEGACTFCTYRPLCMACGDIQVQDSLYTTVENPLAYLEPEVNARG